MDADGRGGPAPGSWSITADAFDQDRQFPPSDLLVITGPLSAPALLVTAFVLLRRQWRSGLAAGSIT
ncbi:hypothetical protein ABZ719_06495 [Streptomyces sp. NPDC006743]|uniref:hypothetical protein n=1 Tax=Streptomyces sp. NPDC006743 TaxID=3154480 RepID=UPI00345511DD